MNYVAESYFDEEGNELGKGYIYLCAKCYKKFKTSKYLYPSKKRLCPLCRNIPKENWSIVIHNQFGKVVEEKFEYSKLAIKSSGLLKLRFEVFMRDNFTCRYCGRTVKEDGVKLHIDHIIPKSKGGKNNLSNLITSCLECNYGKCCVLLEERHKNKLKIGKSNLKK